MQKCNTILRHHDFFKRGKDASNFYMKEWKTNYIKEEETKKKTKKLMRGDLLYQSPKFMVKPVQLKQCDTGSGTWKWVIYLINVIA